MRYMISGSVATVHYGEPRLTLDIDLVLHLEPGDAERFPEIFPSKEYYLPPPEVLAAEISRPTRGHFNIIHVETGQAFLDRATTELGLEQQWRAVMAGLD